MEAKQVVSISLSIIAAALSISTLLIVVTNTQAPSIKDYEPKIAQLENSNKNLETKIKSAKQELDEFKFLIRSKPEYSFNGSQFKFNRCCVSSTPEGLTLIGYDLLIEDPLGSGNYDDFGTSSYISFLGNDTIKSILAQKQPYPAVGVYKIIIDSEYRHTEGVIYPNTYESGTDYERVYVIENDGKNYYTKIKSTPTGITVELYHKNSGTLGTPDKTFALTKVKDGYIRQEVQK
jgi:hypothetical protein